MLTERFPLERIAESLLPASQWCPFPPAADRAAWVGLLRHPLNVRRRAQVLALAEDGLAQPWPVIPLSRYYDFVRTGDRDAFENLYMPRRQALAAMVMAACFSHEARHIEAAADMMWAICEESSWAVSAHVERRGGTDIAPDLARPTIALFACETAFMLAEACYLLRAELDALSPAIRTRIEAEIERRIVGPFGERSDFFWLPFHNNWTPWCVSSALSAAAYTVRDRTRLAQLICHGLELLEPFLAHYPADFACDEGPSYWAASPGALLMILELLHSLSGGTLDAYDEPAVAAMGRYLADMHLAGPWFFAYSDSPARMRPPIAKTYRYGERIGAPGLCRVALLAQRNWDPDGEPDASLGLGVRCGDLLYALRELFWVPADAAPPPPSAPPCVWYPHSQLLVAREQPGRQDHGLVLAVKGGCNGEGHNHNDVGEFLVFADGQPVVVDPGRGVYRRQNFTRERYTIWWNAGRGHDLLQFGAHEQRPAGDARAEALGRVDTDTEASLELELAATCLPEAGVESWRRTCRLTRRPAGEIRVADRYRLQRPLPVSFPIFTPLTPTLCEGRATLPLASGRILVMSWDPAILSAAVLPLEDDDPLMAKYWGTTLTRIVFRTRREGLDGGHELAFAITP